MRKALVIGAGQIGTAIAADLLTRGWDVTLATRGRRAIAVNGARTVTIDRDDPAGLSRAVGAGADALIDTIAYDDRHAAQLLAVQHDVGAFAVISSASVYEDDEGRTLDEARGNGFPQMPFPITEAQRTVAPGPETYSTRKAALERAMLDGSTRPVVILRPCAVYGPESRDPREWWFVKRLLDGRVRIPLAYEGESRFQTSSTANIAALLAIALDKPETRILNAVDPSHPTITDIGNAIMTAMDAHADLVPVSAGPGQMGMTPWSIPAPFVLSDAAGRAIGYAPVTDYPAGVVAACHWLVEHVSPDDWRGVLPGLAKYPNELFDYDAEDRWLAERTTSLRRGKGSSGKATP